MRVFVFAAVLLAVTVSAVFAVRHTPHGPVPDECHHVVPSGSYVYEDAEGLLFVRLPSGKVQRIVECGEGKEVDAPLIGHEWDTWAAWENSAGVGSFIGTFSVPNAPKVAPEILYTFTGLQNDNWIPNSDSPTTEHGGHYYKPPADFSIIQPVLEYTAGGYKVASWYVTLTNSYIESTPLPVSPGQHIFGNMTQTGPTEWLILSQVVETGKTTSVTVNRPRLALMNWAYVTLEVYSASTCSNFPTEPQLFTDMVLVGKEGGILTPDWTPLVGSADICNSNCEIVSPTAVTINTQPSKL